MAGSYTRHTWLPGNAGLHASVSLFVPVAEPELAGTRTAVAFGGVGWVSPPGVSPAVGTAGASGGFDVDAGDGAGDDAAGTGAGVAGAGVAGAGVAGDGVAGAGLVTGGALTFVAVAAGTLVFTGAPAAA